MSVKLARHHGGGDRKSAAGTQKPKLPRLHHPGESSTTTATADADGDAGSHDEDNDMRTPSDSTTGSRPDSGPAEEIREAGKRTRRRDPTAESSTEEGLPFCTDSNMKMSTRTGYAPYFVTERGRSSQAHHGNCALHQRR